MRAFDASFWRDRRVLVTGHTGFKGAWLVLWLTGLGARVSGFSLPPPTDPSLFALCAQGRAADRYGDVADPALVAQALAECAPEIVIHMAAQALVRPSYADPLGTYATNVMGTANVLHASMRSKASSMPCCVTDLRGRHSKLLRRASARRFCTEALGLASEREREGCAVTRRTWARPIRMPRAKRPSISGCRGLRPNCRAMSGAGDMGAGSRSWRHRCFLVISSSRSALPRSVAVDPVGERGSEAGMQR